MDLNQQIQLLVDNAPQDGTTPWVVAAIAPVLKVLAGQLRHFHYYILQSLDSGWVLTTLSNRANPTLEKRVIYAFPTIQDVPSSASVGFDPQIIAAPVPVIHILFQMIALETVDSTVFFETPGDITTGTEVRRDDIQNLIETQLKQKLSSPENIA